MGLRAGEHTDDVTYHFDVVAILARVQHRPERTTPVPRLYGFEKAVVDGERDDHYAQLDDHGRYLVKIHFDESGAGNGKASTRVRMMQPHGGNPESFHFPLRKGTEVMLTFEGGDPDRPLIAGVVPNLQNPTLVTAKNATKNILQTGAGNRLVIEDAAGKEYIHLRSAHKGTYLHLGAPFNPAYNKVSATLGTSLSFTQDISTSVTGSDAQTLVEDSRVTIIGRSRISSADPPGAEIMTILGPGFINQSPESDLFNQIQADVTQIASDLKALKALMPATATNVSSVLSAIKAVLVDLDAFATDAQSYQLIAGTPPAPLGFDATLAATWVAQVGQATTDMTTALTDAGATTPDPATVSSDVGTAIGTACIAAGLDSAKFKPLSPPPATPPPVPSGTMPTLPGPSATPTYINIAHPTWQTTTLSTTFQKIDDWIHAQAIAPPATGTPVLFSDLESQDATAMDVTTVAGLIDPPPLHPGSDIKIVGGDNVTMAAHDARSHIAGRSFGLVLGGQASVVRNAQQSRVMAPRRRASPSSRGRRCSRRPTPSTRSPIRCPPSTRPPTSRSARRCTGDTFAWVDGSTTSTVTSGTHTVVFSPAQLARRRGRRRLFPSPLPPPAHPIPTPQSDSRVAQAAELYGNQWSWVVGDVNATITGTKTSVVNGDVGSTTNGSVDTTITGSQTTHVPTQSTHVTTSTKTAVATADLTAFKLAITGLAMNLNGVAIAFNAMKIDITVFKLANHGINLVTTDGHLHFSDFHLFT